MEVLLFDLTINLKMFWVGIKSIKNSDMLHLLTQLLKLTKTDIYILSLPKMTTFAIDNYDEMSFTYDIKCWDHSKRK